METVGGGERKRFFIPLVRYCDEFQQIATITDGKIFLGHPSNWTQEQRDLFTIWKFYQSVQELPRNEQPPSYILDDLSRLLVWVENYSMGIRGKSREGWTPLEDGSYRSPPMWSPDHSSCTYIVEKDTEYP